MWLLFLIHYKTEVQLLSSFAQTRRDQTDAIASDCDIQRVVNRRGLAGYFQVVDAELITLNMARQRVQTQANQLRYTVQLVWALGGGWE